jgi:hypothetical protein
LYAIAPGIVLALAGCGGDRASEAPPDASGSFADAAACEPGDPARERWGTNCLCCHSGEFSVAGSIDPSGAPVARIVVTDSVGGRAEMAPNPYGNFFRHNALVPPLTAVAYGPDGRARVMPMPAPHAACNECHHPLGVAPRIVGP